MTVRDSIAVDVASLCRLETILVTAYRWLLEESDSVTYDTHLSFRLHLCERERGCDEYVLSHFDLERDVRQRTITTTNSVITATIDDRLNDDGGEEEEEDPWYRDRADNFHRAVADLCDCYDGVDSRRIAEMQRMDAFARVRCHVSDGIFDARTRRHIDLFLMWFGLLTMFPLLPQEMNFVINDSRRTIVVLLSRRAATVAAATAPPLTMSSASSLLPATIVVTYDEYSPFSVTNGDDITLDSLEIVAQHNDDVDVILKDSCDDDAIDDSCRHSRRRRNGGARRPLPSHHGSGGSQRTSSSSSSLALTSEQSRVMALVRMTVCGNDGVPSLPSSSSSSSSSRRHNDSELDLLDTILCRSDDDDLSSRRGSKRLLIDGVAGAGKTFILGALLESFERVLYLVKKKSFVDTVLQRFGNDPRLRARTIDSFLMQHLEIKNLTEWLDRQTRDLSGLKRRIRPCSRDDRELIFVDEYSLIERSLAELLELALTERRVVIVGDCNQQSAIGDAVDQPVRTMLNFAGRVCFMYDNVRTKDLALVERLRVFGMRFDDLCLQAIRDLPITNVIDMKEFFCVLRRADWIVESHVLRLLPRIIVVSNDRVNFLNWAIGRLVWSTMPEEVRGRNCLRYRRRIILLRFDVNDDDLTRSIRTDDPFANEQYVVVGMRYRMIDLPYPSCPARVGSRVIVRSIRSDDTVILSTDDDRSQEFAVNMSRIKPYEYGSVWRREHGSRIHMFPFVLDAATTVYQVQGMTLDVKSYARCYIDVKGMDERALYVSLSRFQEEGQIVGVINAHYFL